MIRLPRITPFEVKTVPEQPEDAFDKIVQDLALPLPVPQPVEDKSSLANVHAERSFIYRPPHESAFNKPACFVAAVALNALFAAAVVIPSDYPDQARAVYNIAREKITALYCADPSRLFCR